MTCRVRTLAGSYPEGPTDSVRRWSDPHVPPLQWYSVPTGTTRKADASRMLHSRSVVTG